MNTEKYVCIGSMRNGKSYCRASDITQAIMQAYPNQSVCVISLDDYQKALADERAKTIDECINVLSVSIPFSGLSGNLDIIHGFYCAIERLKQLKEKK